MLNKILMQFLIVHAVLKHLQFRLFNQLVINMINCQ